MATAISVPIFQFPLAHSFHTHHKKKRRSDKGNARRQCFGKQKFSIRLRAQSTAAKYYTNRKVDKKYRETSVVCSRENERITYFMRHDTEYENLLHRINLKMYLRAFDGLHSPTIKLLMQVLTSVNESHALC